MTRYKSKPGKITAYCHAGGAIRFTSLKRPLVPIGALPILGGEPKKLRALVVATARHAYDGKTLLVPGIPEADNQSAKLDALFRYRDWLMNCPGFKRCGFQRIEKGSH